MVAISPDNQWSASVSSSAKTSTLHLFSVRDKNKETCSISFHGNVNQMELSSDGRHLMLLRRRSEHGNRGQLMLFRIHKGK